MSKWRDAHAPREAQESSSHGDKKATTRRKRKNDKLVVETSEGHMCTRATRDAQCRQAGRQQQLGTHKKGKQQAQASVKN